MPHIANTLVAGATPRRPSAPIDRFSPLRLIGTPRVRSRPSGLRYDQEAEDGGERRKTLFGPRQSSVAQGLFAPDTTRPVAKAPDDEVADDAQEGVADETVILAPPLPTEATMPESPSTSSTPITPITPAKPPLKQEDATPRQTTARDTPPEVDGVDLTSTYVGDAIVSADLQTRLIVPQGKIWSSLSEAMSQGLVEGQVVPPDVGSRT